MSIMQLAHRVDELFLGGNAADGLSGLPLEGARLIGFLEQGSGMNVWAVAARLGMDETQFAEVLVECARAGAPLPGGGTIIGFPVDEVDPATASTREEAAEFMGALMFRDAWASREDEIGNSLSGMRIEDVAPDTPDAAVVEGARLVGMYEQANGCSMLALFNKACDAEYGSPEAAVQAFDADDPHYPTMEHFAQDLAFMALGHGVSWFDDRAEFPLAGVSMEYCEEDGLSPIPGDSPSPA